MKATSRTIKPLAIAVCSLFVVILLLVVGLDIYETKELANLSNEIYEHPLTVSNAVRDIKININAMQRNMMEIVRIETPEQLNEVVGKANAHLNETLKEFDTIEKQFLGDAKYVTSVRRDFEGWRTIRKQVIELMEQGRREESIALIKGKGVEQINLINEGVDGKAGLNYLMEFADAKAKEFRSLVGQKEKRNTINMFITLSLTLILTAALILLLFRFLKTSTALADSETLNRSLLEGSPVCNKIITTDFKLQYMSSAGVEALKISDINTCYGKEYPPKFFCEESRIAIIEKLKVVLTGEISEVECITHTTEGDELWYLHTFVPAFDDNGKVKHIIGSSVETTGRKKYEKELKMSEKKYRSLIENAKDAIISANGEGEIVSFNKTAEEMFGYSYEEILGKSVTLLSLPSERERQKKLLEQLKTTKKLYIIGKTMPGKGVRKNGQEFTYEGSPFTVDIQGEIFLTIIIRDTTERKKMEHKLFQSEKLKSLGELAGGVAHDFNNCLAAILGRAQLLKMVIEPPAGMEEKRRSVIEMKEGLDIIEKASKDGAETVRRIQEFARRRDDDKHFGTVDLNEIIKNALDFCRMKWKDDAESKGIKINIQKEFATLPTTSGSAAELREVLTNLINNAVDAMPQGGEIKIKTYKEDSHIAIKIEDTGVGIPKHIRDKIFDPFFTTKGVQSTGLGMSVSYGIISRHKGTISVDSIEGEGTTFTIKLPITEKIFEKEKAKYFEGEPKKARIMVIEDEEGVRNLLSAILRKGGHEVEGASDGNQGIEMFEKKEFDLVFTDLGMPGMSGWQVAEKIKGINGRVPVVLITGWDIKQEASENKDNWVDLIIHKPFEMEQVLNVVQEGMILRDRFKAT